MFHLVEELMAWIGEHWHFALPLVGVLGAYLLLNTRRRDSQFAGCVVAAIALLLGWATMSRTTGDRVEGFCFAAFSGLAIASAIAMIVQSNPVYAALNFALVILSACGLFLMQAASFLAAATIIVYAGAIIVTFLFVIMLAHQSGRSTYDQNPKQPVLVGVAGVFLLGAILGTIEDSFPNHKAAAAAHESAIAKRQPTPTLPARQSPLAAVGNGGVLELGRTLFSDYLWATELAGTVLLISTIGAIAIAGHRKGAAI